MKKIRAVQDLLKSNEFSTKIYLTFASNVAGDDYDPYEKDYTPSLLNPIVIKGYVREINPEALVWKQYGLANMGAKEILCDDRYENYFRTCQKITIEGLDYQVFKEGTGNRAIIQRRPAQTMRVVVQRMN